MGDDAAHRRAMIGLAQAHVAEPVIVADIFEPPKTRFAPGGGALGLIGLALGWRDANRAHGLPPSVLIAVTADQVYFLKVEGALSGWTVRNVIRHWQRGSFPLAASTTNPAAVTIDIDGQQVRLAPVSGAATAAELAEMLRTNPSR